jgi:serine/threonine protein kinase
MHHPNVVTALDFGLEDSGREYLVLDLQENSVPLAQACADQPVSVHLDSLSQGLRALHCLHGKGVVHRAIEPSNVVVADGRLKMLDLAFSYSKLSASHALRRQNSLYDAAEVMRGVAASQVFDLYSLGLVAYHAFTGVFPFSLESVAEREFEIPRPQDDVDPRRTGMMARLLAFDLNLRFKTALEAFAAIADVSSEIVLETALTRESALQTAQFQPGGW